MSRLTELQEHNIVGFLVRVKSQLVDLKTTAQPTSVKSGVKTYQSPEGDLWDEIEFSYNGVVTKGRSILLPGTGGLYNQRTLTIDTEFEPTNQAFPVVYPYATLSIGGVEWKPAYHPNFGLVFRGDSGQVSLMTTDYLTDVTDYSAERPLYKQTMSVYYATAGTSAVDLKVRYRTRSTDRGKTKVMVGLL